MPLLRRLVCCGALAGTLVAQSWLPVRNAPWVGQLSTDGAGGALYMTTNLTPARETVQRAFKVVGTDGHRFRSEFRETQNLAENPDDLEVSEFWFPQTNSAGDLLAITVVERCPDNGVCPFGAFQMRALVRRAESEVMEIGPGRAHLSANGVWAIAITPEPRPVMAVRRNLLTGAEERAGNLFAPPEDNRRIVADDGSVFYIFGGQLFMWRPGQPVQSTGVPGANIGAIDRSGNWLIASTSDSLIRVNLASFERQTLLQGDGRPVRLLDTSEDGNSVLFRSGADWTGTNPEGVEQAWLLDVPAGRVQQLTRGPASIREAQISGDGRVVYVLGQDFGLSRLGVDSGEETLLAPPVPMIVAQDPPGLPQMAPGGRYWFWGRNMDRVTQVYLDQAAESIPLALENHSAVDFDFVLPLDLNFGPTALRLRDEESPFHAFNWPAGLTRVSAEYLSARGPAWFRPDGRPVTNEDPVSLGEEVEAVMTGIGPVDSAGQAELPLAFYLVFGSRPLIHVPIEYLSIRAAEQRGVYYVRLRVTPTESWGNYAGVRCVSLYGRGSTAFLPIREFVH